MIDNERGINNGCGLKRTLAPSKQGPGRPSLLSQPLSLCPWASVCPLPGCVCVCCFYDIVYVK